MAGSDAGHAFTALGLAARFAAAGDETVVYTGTRWTQAGARRGLTVRELPGLTARDDEDDTDAGAKLSTRAARMAVELAPLLAVDAPDLVICDAITLAGGWAAELVGIPWIELSPHPLYEQSRGLPPIGAGLAVGTGLRGRLRDRVLRALSAPAEARGRAQRAAARRSIGLSAVPAPAARFVATLPGLEEPRPDWPSWTHLIGPQFFEPTDDEFPVPAGSGPLIVVCPSTAQSGNDEMARAALGALAQLSAAVPLRVVYSALEAPAGLDEVPEALIAGLGRQDRILAQADLVICGGGHGLLAKALSAGVPAVVIPGGGDQWELACRVQRAGAGVRVRPADRDAVAAAVGRVLDDPGYAQAAAAIAATVSQTHDPVLVAHRIIEEAA
ncbi:putative glycosyltransferase [Gordonia hirsuta DSM 44140 = NBRC 16056]|uniref:Putative glycosyltransferase n=1 Tax=Gordonia hirsuta DSM 44140 = NBRC 16056 TaxID=1121927 RepID=L7LCC7_9ACTN|nr:nucleotide disphospho-sugar-binding domain-containing protein [Gordonia hirsuta]GAC58549.1 putative glycosyltransferase [Gordonia hirsuta DSM 44140 = NBRC 16056]